MMSDDRDLEDFFARKAKKKTKGKFTTSSKIAQNVEYLQTAEREREQAHLQPAPEKPALPNPEDEEWNDFQEETVRDLSGLKIQGLKKSGSSQSEQPEPVSEQDPAEDDVPVMKSESAKSAGPWQAASGSTAASQPEPIPAATPTSIDSATDQAPVAKYRPGAFTGMAMRDQRPSAPKAYSRGRNRLPDVNSQEAFPTLQSAVDRTRSGAGQSSIIDSTAGFEDVRRGTRVTHELPENRSKLELGNKFDALSSPN